MDFKLVWTPSARADLKAATAYIKRHNMAAAARFSTELKQKVELLKTIPFMGQCFSDDSTGPNREITIGNYRIIYRVNEDEKRVEILMIWHGARLEPQLPEEE